MTNPTLKRFVFYILAGIVVSTVFETATTAAEKVWSITDFMRVTVPPGKKKPVSFDTAIVQFTDVEAKLQVDLVSAVHIGDTSYYEELNRRFKRYDAVLYELVAKTGTKPNKAKVQTSKKRSVLSSFQSGIGEAMNLDFQLSVIDYQAPNMIHADLSPEEFYRRAADRGDAIQMIFRSVMLGMKKSGDKNAEKEEIKSQGRLMAVAFAPNPPLALKRYVAMELMRQSDDAELLFGGAEGSAIITDRNAAALQVLKMEIGNGKKKIAIFYGGAHLADFAEHLEKDFHLKPTSTDWITAWDLKPATAAK
ncbi:hypothetical protein FACS1894170_05410 [Planctomycetales bacterium]|nr:hypothetical protein FACS1894170_05410 [Planctomycetales bacterium]